MLKKIRISFAWRRIRTKGLNLDKRKLPQVPDKKNQKPTKTSHWGKSLEQAALVDYIMDSSSLGSLNSRSDKQLPGLVLVHLIPNQFQPKFLVIC